MLRIERNYSLSGVLIIIFILSLNVFGQYGASFYEPTWLDGEPFGQGESNIFEPNNYGNEPVSQILTCAAGVVEQDPNSYFHVVTAQITITTPNGSVQTEYGSAHAYGNYSTTVVMSAIYALSDFAEVPGIYQINTLYGSECPFLPYGAYGSSYTNIPIGVSFIGMQLVNPQVPTPAGWLYEKVTPCETYCNAPQTNRTSGGPYACIQLQIPYGPLGCSYLVRVKKGSICYICYDVGWN